MVENTQINVICSDGIELKVDREIAYCFEAFKEVFEEETELEVNFKEVDSRILRKVVQFCEYLKLKNPPEIEPRVVKEEGLQALVGEWQSTWINQNSDHETLFPLITAANYLNIPRLVRLTCAKLATMINGRSVEQVRQQFNITNDFTPEEEDQLQAERQ